MLKPVRRRLLALSNITDRTILFSGQIYTTILARIVKIQLYDLCQDYGHTTHVRSKPPLPMRRQCVMTSIYVNDKLDVQGNSAQRKAYTQALVLAVCGALMHVAPPNSLFTTMSFIRGAFLLVTCIGSIAIGIWQGHAILFSPQFNPVYGPNPILFALLVLAQGMLQVFWLWKIYLRESALAGEAEHLPEAKVDEVNNSGRYNAELLFSPILVIEYICLIAWHLSWRKENFIRCEIISMFNTAIHLFAVYWLFPQTCDSAMVSEGTARTRLLTRTSTGIAFLYMWKVWGVIDEAIAPAISQRLQTGAVFILLTISSGPEPTLGLCLLCNLIVMILGPCQISEWRKTFICISTAIAVVVVWDYFMNGRRQGVMLGESSEESVEESHALVELRVPAIES